MSVSVGQTEYGRLSNASRGEDIRTRPETRIAQFFTENGIRFEYERVPQSDMQVFGRIFERPFYYLPDYGIYVKYWGFVRASRKQVQKMRRKMTMYNRREIRFISLFLGDIDRLGLIFRARFREIAGFELPHHVHRTYILFCSVCGTPAEAGSDYCVKCVRKLV